MSEKIFKIENVENGYVLTMPNGERYCYEEKLGPVLAMISYDMGVELVDLIKELEEEKP